MEDAREASLAPASRSPMGACAAALVRREWPPIWVAGFAAAVLLIFQQPVYGHFGPIFGEMLARLLHGQFDISPATIGGEAFIYRGRSYAYFGVFCALLRLPLLLTGHIGLDVTKASMIAAAGVSLAARLAATSLALSRAQTSRPVRLIILAAVAFGGESLQYLRPSIYQEVCSWGAALAAIFVLLAVRRLVDPARKPGRLYAGMAAVAGLALLCRVSFGLGLYAGLGLMLLVEASRGWRTPGAARRTLAPAALVLALFVGAAAGVNVARWGDPLTFVPIRYQLIIQKMMPERIARLDRYGEANLRRAPFAVQYYFTPVWMLQDRHGRLLFQQTQLDLFDSVELPPSSFLLSDPLVCLLAGLGLWTLARRPARIPDARLATAGLAGLALPVGVMLTAISLTFRYRMDFYPSLDFAACLGAASLRLDPAREPAVQRIALGGAALGAVVAIATLGLYILSMFGPALDLDMSHGWLTPMLDAAHGHNPSIGHLLPDGRRLGVLR